MGARHATKSLSSWRSRKSCSVALQQKDLTKWFPDDGPFARDLYPKHRAFFRAGVEHRERCFLAANRVGKTIAGGYETALHQTGLYPDWWDGGGSIERRERGAPGRPQRQCATSSSWRCLGRPMRLAWA